MAKSDRSQIQTMLSGLACRCPRCGKGKLFQGFLTLKPKCEACGLDYAFIDAGDGPAVFVVLLAGFVVVTCALIVEFKYAPPFWVHAVLWGPLILVTTLWPLRAMKGLLIALQYWNKAAEGRLEQQKADDGRLEQQKAGDGRLEQQKAGDGRLEQQKAGDGRLEQQKAGDGRLEQKES